jgi:hypothetical protein
MTTDLGGDPIPPRAVSEDDLFAEHWQKYGR